MYRKLIAFWVAALTLLGAAGFAAGEDSPWRCLYGEWLKNDADEYLFTLYELDVRTGEGVAFASLPDFHVWSAAADRTWDTVLLVGFDLKADDRFVCYRLAGPGSAYSTQEPEVILEFKGPRQPEAEVIFDADEGAFFVGAEAIGTDADGEKYRETVLYRYEPTAKAPVELARLGCSVSLEGEADETGIYVTYDDDTSYGRSRLYGYVDKNTFDVVPLGIFPDYFGGEPTRYVPYVGPEGAGQYLPAASAMVAGPRAYAEDTAKAEAAAERAIYLRDPASPGGYREVKVKGAPGPIFYSRSHDAFVYVIYPTKDEGPTHVAVTYPDGTSAEPVTISTAEDEAANAAPPYDYGLLYVE